MEPTNAYVSCSIWRYPYYRNFNIGWEHHSSTSWEERQDTSHSPHVQRSSLEDTIAKLARSRAKMEESRAQVANESLEKTMTEVRRSQANLTIVQAKNEILMGDMDYSQDGLPRFYVQNEMSKPPQEKMSNLEATMAKLRRVQAKLATSQARFMEKVHTPSQDESNFESEVDELAITMAKLANYRAELLKGKRRTKFKFNP